MDSVFSDSGLWKEPHRHFGLADILKDDEPNAVSNLSDRAGQRGMENRTVHSGFTLVELMMVVAVIGVLAALAIPQYQDYVTRVRWQDNYQGVLPIKTAVAQCAQNSSGAFAAAPCDSLASLISASYLPPGTTGVGRFASAVAWNGAAIQIDGNTAARNCVVTFTPVIAGGGTHLSWSVGSATPGCSRDRIGA